MEQKQSGAEFLYLALYAFAGVGLELVVVMAKLPSIIHWVVVSVVWFGVGVFLIRYAKKKFDFDLPVGENKLNTTQYLIAVCFVLTVAISYFSWQGFKPLLEFQRLGAVSFVFQYIYYIFETFLFSLIIVFGQKAGEIWFKNEKIPYGGITLALTWGVMHILTKGSVAVGAVTALTGVLYGAVYLFTGKNYKIALPILCLMFMV